MSAIVTKSSRPHPRVLNLIEKGVEVRFRPIPYPLWKEARRALVGRQRNPITLEAQQFFRAKRPGLVVISDGGNLPPADLLELCIERRIPFVTIYHANSEWWWPTDDFGARYRAALGAAQRCYFVSKANLRLYEKQIGRELPNAEVVWNPVNVAFDEYPAWPQLGPEGEFRFACVARLDPRAKGQDILFEVLAQPSWADRSWRLFLYGEGPMRTSLERLVRRIGLADRVIFAGHAEVADIWALNHVLVMPSRIEGLPLAMVEAMLCGRPVVATDVAGHAEVIEDGVTGFLAHAPTVGSMAEALDRFWTRRAEAQMIGQAGSKRIRQLLPPDPVRVFSSNLKHILRTAEMV